MDEIPGSATGLEYIVLLFFKWLINKKKSVKKSHFANANSMIMLVFLSYL
jgi:hypothetical protein